MRNPRKTFCWIVRILKDHNIRFVISGGLAAKAYGSPRPLNDIDIDIPQKDFYLISEMVSPYIIYGPSNFRDERWDLLLMTLNHEKQEIDLSGGETIKICDARNGVWVDSPTDFDDIEQKEIFGVTVPVMSKTSLVSYKSMLTGEHQLVDIQSIAKSPV